MLAQAKDSPDINNYLAYILSSTAAPEDLRTTRTNITWFVALQPS